MVRSLPVSFLILTLIGSVPRLVSAEEKVDFNREIRPILSDKCFQCHGPDDQTLKGDLRLDQRESALSGGAIVAGDVAASELIARITASDPDEVMPPPKVKKPVTREEAELLRRWIEQGAEYAGHWAFEPVQSMAPPETSGTAKPGNEIDRFVLAALEEKGLALSPEADPETLARRLSLDLTGLLPPPERVASFREQFAKNSDAAVDGLVDELLASPHYGERWGRHWLDQARYADSNGYTIDGERVMWPYRDWVIRAINEDMPFDRFTIEQIAGDLLPHPDKSQLIASGFHRNTLINQEGGTDDEQFRNEEVVDRVNTTGAVWLGLTLGCAQCHTHKFDPISQKEYFELFAFFNHGEDVNNTGPTVEVSEGELLLPPPDPGQLSRWEATKKAVSELERNKAARQDKWEEEILASARAEEETPVSVEWTRLRPLSVRAEAGSPLRTLDDQTILAGRGAPSETYRVSLPAPKDSIAAIRLQLLTHESLPKNGPGLASNGNIVLTRVEFYQGGKRIAVARAEHDHAQPGFSAAFTIDENPDTGWAINIGKGTRPGVRMNADHEARYVLAKPIQAGGAPLEVVLRHEKNSHYNVGRFALESSPRAPRPVLEEELLTKLAIPKKDRSNDDKKFLAGRFAEEDAELRQAKASEQSARKALGYGAPVKTMVMRDRKEPRDTYVHVRGDFLRHDEEIGKLSPGVPAVLPGLLPMKEGKEARDRLDLAHWLVRGDHPLTPRVTVNRAWMRFFGRGIVETENDFGTQGSYPTHPALLDWLARSFVDDGWSMKKLHKRIVTSATYRQRSVSRPELAESDPLNLLLGRQSRIRVEAGIVRDAALSASGLLHPKIGGPGVMPPQPDGVYAFTQRKVNWVAATDENRFRRALYIKFFRSAPYPLLTTFDSPDFQGVCTSRVRSNTPLQSLMLANDEAMFELARGLGVRLMHEVKGTDSTANRDRIRRAFQLCYSREPGDSELEMVAGFQEAQQRSFAEDETGSKAVAPNSYPGEFDLAAAASWTAVARALMNTDEFITRE